MKKTALITGASSGIGAAFAQVFAKNGYNLVITARSTDKLDALAQELKLSYGIDTLVIPTDLSQYNSADMIYKTCKDKNIQIDVLVNNAGFGDFGMFYESDWAKTREMIDLNIMALTHLTHLYITDMVQRRSGKILNVASTAAFQPGPLMSVYYASKAYVLYFTEGIANELKGTGVTATALCPGPVESNFQKKANMEGSKLFNRMKIPMPQVVAEYGYKALMQGKTVAIQGTLNYLMAQSSRFAPRNMVAAMVRKMQEASK